MATKVLDKNQARVPFLGDKMTFIHGLDPLGLQNPSVQMYSFLQPGLNNVTNRLRYYSFYCWLLSEYAKQIQSTSPAEQKRFVRRAEYIIALASVNAKIQGIPGSIYATRRIEEALPEYKLQDGTYNPDGSTDRTYWKYPFGIFGQYYLGSLRQLGLIDEPTDQSGQALGIYRRTAKGSLKGISGEELADAFNENITESNKTLFYSCIDSGTISQGQLGQLMPDFNFTDFNSGSLEAKLLIQILSDIDEPSKEQEEPSTMRKDTLAHILRLTKESNNETSARNFTLYAYELQGCINNIANKSLTGWYYYSLNEYWQVSCTAILHGCLDYLEELSGPGWLPLQELVSKSSEAILQFLIENDFIGSKSQRIDDITSNISKSEQELNNDIFKERKVERMAYAYLLIWKLYQSNKNNLNKLLEYTREQKIVDGEDVLSFYKGYEKFNSYSVESFIREFLLSKIIYRHHYVAYKKMGTGNQSTQKFILEENHIRKIDNFNPVNTGPRIGNLINFLVDLKILNTDKQLTEQGEELLTKLEQE